MNLAIFPLMKRYSKSVQHVITKSFEQSGFFTAVNLKQCFLIINILSWSVEHLDEMIYTMLIQLVYCSTARKSFAAIGETPSFWSTLSCLEMFLSPTMDCLWMLRRCLGTPSDSWKQNVVWYLIVHGLRFMSVSFVLCFMLMLPITFPDHYVSVCIEGRWVREIDVQWCV